MDKIIEMLNHENYSCVIENGGKIFTFNKPGLSDLYYLLTNEPSVLKDATIADRIVGKAAAALIILGRVKKVYARIISVSALNLLRKAEIPTDFDHVVPFLRNHDRTDFCPLEKKCDRKKKPEDILPIITEFITKNKTP